MPKVTLDQALSLGENGFRHGIIGYPILWSDNGRITIVDERKTHLVVWEFEPDGTVHSRRYMGEGKKRANISTSR